MDDTGVGTPPIVDMGAYEKRLPGPPTDYDGDSDVDQLDFAVFQGCVSGDGVPADLHCAD